MCITEDDCFVYHQKKKKSVPAWLNACLQHCSQIVSRCNIGQWCAGICPISKTHHQMGVQRKTVFSNECTNKHK